MGYTETIFSSTGLNIILALSVYFSLTVGQFSLAQVGFWAIGAYVSAMLTALYGWPLLPALCATAIVCAALGVLLGFPCLRIRGMYLALATLGFSQVATELLSNFHFRVDVDGVLRGPEGLVGFRNIPVLTNVFDIYIFVALLLVFLWALERSRFGLVLVAVREDDVAAEFAGVNVVSIKVTMFALGAAVAGVGGGLFANYTSFISAQDFSFHQTLFSLLYVSVGGVTTFIGPVLGAVLLTLLPEYVRFLGDNRAIFYGVLVLVVMILRPRGLIDRSTFDFLRGLKRPAAKKMEGGRNA